MVKIYYLDLETIRSKMMTKMYMADLSNQHMIFFWTNKSLELTEVFDFEYRVRLKLLFSYWLNKT